MPFVLIIVVIISAIAGLLFVVLPGRQSPAEQQAEQQALLPDLSTTDTSSTTPAKQKTYTNGTYSANASYFTPKRVRHNISVTITINDDTITTANVLYDGAEAKTPSHTNFDGAYEQLVLGVEIDDLDLARVGGASLTTTAFNEALSDIASDASPQ